MTDLCFVDTNVFVHAVDDREPAKQAVARGLIQTRAADLVVSPQVASEFFRVASDRLGLGHAQASEGVDLLASFRCVDLDLPLVQDAAALAQRRSLSIWDALIVRAAVRGGCSTLFTEDLADGDEIDGITIVNPFAGA